MSNNIQNIKIPANHFKAGVFINYIYIYNYIIIISMWDK